MSDVAPDSPAVRLYSAYVNQPPEIMYEFYPGSLDAEGANRMVAEHERIVAERIAAVTAERDAAIADIAKLAIPQAVYLNLLTGRIAKPNHHQINHIYPDLVSETIAEVTAERDTAIAERDRLRKLIDTPINDDWFFGAKIEAVHQQERWGVSHDQGKSPLDWFWLIGYLAQKVTESAINGDIEKAKHHTISTAAALLNWHRHLSVEPATLMQASTIPDVAPNSEPRP